ncbi:MAG: LacI family DNA-binding transcriptional regulator [Oscillospiraceae bacterium]
MDDHKSGDQSTRPTTLKDVANKAGVSAMAVSNALNNRGRISAQTYEKIIKAAKELNYTPNQVAKSLRKSRTCTIGVVMSDASHYVFAELLRGISHAASQKNYSVLLADTGGDPSAEEKMVQLLLSRRIDGLIMAAPSAVNQADIERLKAFNTPFVFLMRTSEFMDVEYIVNDNISGCYQGIKHLYETGSREFIFITIDSSSGRDRIKGYRQYLDQQQLNFEDYYSINALPQIDSGYEAMKKILNKGYRHGTVCCGCDMIAIGAMDAIYEANLSIPKDFRLFGYDDLEMAPYLRVPLSTVRQPFYEIGVEGFRVLINRIENPDSPIQSVILQPQLVIRQSTDELQ